MNRKKRLAKGILSLGEEIEYHKEKMNKAREEGDLELADYYEKEISGLEKTKERKEKQIEKS